MARPRGFIENWKPTPDVLQLVQNCQSVIRINKEFLPLTLRQIYYYLVSNYKYDKTQKAYKRLCETMNKARRAKMIDMDCVRDDGMTKKTAFQFQTEAHFIRWTKLQSQEFRLDRQENQDTKLIVWCEAAGMVPQLHGAVKKYGIPVLSSGGFDSLTSKHKIAKMISDLEDVEILHLGDHDPSGVHLYKSLDEDLDAFLDHFGGVMELTRLAVTPAQVETMNLPTSPPKSTDKRSFEGLTTQCEAIPPRRLNEILIEAVEYRIDYEAYNDTLTAELVIRKNLERRLRGI